MLNFLMNEDKKNWAEAQHEAKVENFYGTGIAGFHDYHGGYLNFGYWTRDNMSYLEAAENLVKTMGEKLGLDGQSHLLDVGCGMGTQDVYLLNNFKPAKIDAMDVTWKHIERARERAGQNQVSTDKLQYHHGTAVQIPFEKEKFTHLLSIEAPEHFDTREKFFYEAYRVLKPGGVMQICDYSLVRPPKNFIERFVVEMTRKLWQVPMANVYGNDIYQKKLEAAGFRDIKIENVGQYTIPGYYHCHRRPEEVSAMKKIRGFWKGIVGGFLIDVGVYGAFKFGVVEYVFVKAVKPNNA